jgi:transcriptional regulator with XRE-family HTH domain
MTLQAIGAYLQRLREEARISRHALAKKVKTSDSQIIRIEEGLDTRFSLLAMIVIAVNASIEDVLELSISETNIAEDGIRLAESLIERRKTKDNSSVSIHPDVARLLGSLTDYELGRWVLLGEQIIEERNKLR